MSRNDKVETKLAAARTRLILDKPFLGALVLRLPMVEGDATWCKTTATDARSFYYNHDYISSLSIEQTQFVLAHEALHCALSHFARRQHRVKHRWDLACDYAVNPLLVKDGLTPPPGTLLLDEFEDMTAEEIYPSIDENNDEETLDQHMYDQEKKSETRGKNQQPDEEDGGGLSRAHDQEASGGAAPQPEPLTETERQELGVRWQQNLAGAAQQALLAGKLGGAMGRMVDHLLQPQLPWRMLLARYLTSMGRDDYSLMTPSARREGPAIFPSLRSAQIQLTVILDTSGSINDTELNEFISEVNAIKGQINARIVLHACDDHLSTTGPWTYEPWDEFSLPDDLQGGGATSFIPAFEWAQQQNIPPDLLIYFTDAEGEFPAHEPAFPVVWLVKGKSKVPWGERVQLN